MTSTVKIYDASKPNFSFSDLSFWQIAALGTVPVIGLGAWYYYRSSKKVESDSSGKDGAVSKNKLEPLSKQVQAGLKTEVGQGPLQRAQSLKDSGNGFFKEGKYVEALKCYSEAIELCPSVETTTLSTLYQNRAACHDQMNNLEGVVKDCTEALKLNPKYTKSLARRAKAFQLLKKLTPCLEDITAVCILESFSNQKSLMMADEVLKQLGKDHAREAMKNKEPTEPSSYFVKSYFMSFPNDPVIKASDFEAVEINSSVVADGDSSSSHLERAKQLLYRARYAQVIPACTQAIEAGEGLEPEALLLRATMFLLRGQHGLALDDLNTLIDSQVQNAKITINALIKRASLFLQSDDKENSFKDFEAAVELDADVPDIYLHRGQVHLLSENLEQSLADYRNCSRLDPEFGIGVVQGHYAEYRKCISEQSGGGVAKAIEKLKRDLKKFPRCIEAYILLAQVLMDQQNYDEADEYFLKAQDIDPKNATLRVHRGLLMLQWKGDTVNACRIINEAIQIDDRCSFCYETLGTIEVQQGKLKLAVELFDKAIPLSKTEAELAHIYSLRDAAEAQLVVAQRLGITIG